MHLYQMLIHKVDPEHILPVPEPLHVLKCHIPSCASVSLAQGALTPGLVGHAPQLLYRTDIAELRLGMPFVELVEKHVHSRHLVPCVHGHVVRAGADGRPVVLPVVACPYLAPFFAPAVHRSGPAVCEKVQQYALVVMAHLPPVALFRKEARQVLLQPVSPFPLERGEEVRCPPHSARGVNLRLVREHSFYMFHPWPQFTFVCIHRKLDELAGHALHHEVDIREAGVPRSGRVVCLAENAVVPVLPGKGGRLRRDIPVGITFPAEYDKDVFQIGREVPCRLHHQALPLVVRPGHLLRHISAGETARIGILVIYPDIHPGLHALVDAVSVERHPLIRKVFGHKARPGVYEHPAETRLLHLRYGSRYLFSGLLPVPDPQRGRAVVGRRLGEARLQLFERYGPFIPGGTPQGQCRQQESEPPRRIHFPVHPVFLCQYSFTSSSSPRLFMVCAYLLAVRFSTSESA